MVNSIITVIYIAVYFGVFSSVIEMHLFDDSLCDYRKLNIE